MARLGGLCICLESVLLVAKENRNGAALNEHIRVMGVLWIKKMEAIVVLYQRTIET